MENFWSDLSDQLSFYYDALVRFTPRLAVALVFLAVIWFLARSVRRGIVKRLGPRLEDPLLVKFLASLLKGIVWIIGLFVIMRILDMGNFAAGLIGTAGVGAFIIGFAFKDIGEHFLAGIILAFNRPFRVGDIVELGGVRGVVTQLHLRDTHLKTFDGRDIYIPNGNIIKNPLTNFTIDGFMRYEFTIGLDYGTDVLQVTKLILDTLKGIPGILQDDKPPSVLVADLGASTLNITVYFWMDTFDKSFSAGVVRMQAVQACLNALDEKGIYLPSDILEIKNYKGGVLELESSGRSGASN